MPRSTDIHDIALAVIRARMRLHFMVTPKGDRGAAKIFVIGHPRCGTTTLHRLFLANGLSSFHGARDWPTGRYDAFSDFGQVRPVAACDRTYPDARFILNFRPLRHYLISIATHHQKVFGVQDFVNEAHRRADWFARVLRHFRGRANIMAVNIEAPGALTAVADFCGLARTRPAGGTVHNASTRPSLPRNEAHVDAALAALGLCDEARQAVLVSVLHGAAQDELRAARDSIVCVQ